MVHGVLVLSHVVWARLIPDIKYLLFASESCRSRPSPSHSESLTHGHGSVLSEVQTETGRSTDEHLLRLSHAPVESIVEDSVARLVTEYAMTRTGFPS